MASVLGSNFERLRRASSKLTFLSLACNQASSWACTCCSCGAMSMRSVAVLPCRPTCCPARGKLRPCLVSAFIKSYSQEAALSCDRGEVSACRMNSHAVIAALDPFHDVQASLIPSVIAYLVHALNLQRFEEAFRRPVAPSVALPAHRHRDPEVRS